MAIIVDPVEVIEEGQLQIAQFPTVEEDQARFESLISGRIMVATAQIKQASPGAYASTDEEVQALVRLAIIYITLGYMWQMIKAVMDGYDAERLPPEYVNPDQAADNRDWYFAQASQLISTFSPTATDNPKLAVPVLATVGLDQDDTRTSSMVERWSETGLRPE